MMDIEEIIPGADVARRRREQWEAEHLSALAERRAKKQPITERDVELHYERLLVAAAPLVNARAAEVRARQERIKTRQPRSITPPPLAPRTVEPLAPPRKKAVKSPALSLPSAALADGPAAVVRRAPSMPAPRPVVVVRPPEIVKASPIPPVTQEAIRRLHAEGVPIKILARVYSVRQADVRAALAGGASCRTPT